MPYYVKVTEKVRNAILPSHVDVKRTFDGNYLVYQSALSGVKGNTLSERAERVGGALLTTTQAKAEMDGTSCEPCHTPAEYGGETAAKDTNADGGQAEVDNASTDMPGQTASEYYPNGEQTTLETPSVEVKSEEQATSNDNNDNQESEVEDE